MNGERKFAETLRYTNDWAGHSPDRFKVVILLVSGPSADAMVEMA